MPTRPRHPTKELEALLKELENQGWRVVKTKYYKVYCPCKLHISTVHLTPSNPMYQQNLEGKLRRTGCFEQK